MDIDLRKIPSYLITRGPVPPHFDDYRLTTIQAGDKVPHITDCTWNHFRSVEHGIDQCDYPFAVYEEDAWPTEWYSPCLVDIPYCDMLKIDLSKLARHGPEWDWNPEYSVDELDRRLIHVVNMLSSAAYLVMTPKMGRELAQALYDGHLIGVASDCAMIPLMRRNIVLALSRPLFYQGPEDNQHADKTNWCIE